MNNAPVNPSECYANICIVLSKDGKHNSSTTVKANKLKGKPYTFEVTQYVYNCTLLTKRNAAIINQMVQQIPQKAKFYDPLMTDTDKHAGVYKLTPNQPIQTIVSQPFVGVEPMQMIPQNTVGNNARPSTNKSYGADAVSESKNNESKNTKNMKKNAIKLNENQLRQIVAESVKKVLKEDYDFNADFEDGGSVYDRWGEPTEEEAFRDIVLTRLCNALNAEATRIIDDYEYEWQEGQKVINKIWLDTYGDGAPGLSYEG